MFLGGPAHDWRMNRAHTVSIIFIAGFWDGNSMCWKDIDPADPQYGELCGLCTFLLQQDKKGIPWKDGKRWGNYAGNDLDFQ